MKNLYKKNYFLDRLLEVTPFFFRVLSSDSIKGGAE
jgi:hypothetical protein